MTAGGREINATGQTSLQGCTQVGAAKVEELSGGAVEFTRTLKDSASGRTVTVVDRFKPEKENSVRWEIEVVSEGEPWTVPITTELNYPATSATRFWTAWADPVYTNWFDTDRQTGLVARSAGVAAIDRRDLGLRRVEHQPRSYRVATGDVRGTN